MRFPGKTKYLYLGRGSGKEGIWIDEVKPEPFLRKQDKFLEYFRKHLGSSSFRGVEVDSKDRIFSINYAKWGRINRFLIFYKARNLYFANHFYDEKKKDMLLFRSWTMSAELKPEVSFDIFDEIGRIQLANKNTENEIVSFAKLLKEERIQAKKTASGKKTTKFLNRKRKRILEDLERIKSLSQLESLVEKEPDWSKYEQKLMLGNVKIKFKTNEHFHRRDEVYSKIKKLKKAKKILSLRLGDTEKELGETNKITLENNLKTISPVWKKASNIKKKTVSEDKNYRLFDFGNYIIGVGISAQGNDSLRKDWAKKDDVWFHLEGDKSPHAIIKLKGAQLTQDIMAVVAAIIVDLGKFNYNEANLIYTPVKNIKGVKGAAGKVIYKKEKHITVVCNDHYRELLP